MFFFKISGFFLAFEKFREKFFFFGGPDLYQPPHYDFPFSFFLAPSFNGGSVDVNLGTSEKTMRLANLGNKQTNKQVFLVLSPFFFPLLVQVVVDGWSCCLLKGGFFWNEA